MRLAGDQVGDAVLRMLEREHLLDGVGRAVALEEAVLEHPVVVVDLREVAATTVGNRGQDRLPGPVAPRRFEHCEDRRPARAAGEDPFFPGEPAGRHERVAVGDLHVLVHDRRVEGRGERVLADPLDQVRMDWAAGVDRPLRVGADDDQVGLLLLQVSGCAGDRAAGADTEHDNDSSDRAQCRHRRLDHGHRALPEGAEARPARRRRRPGGLDLLGRRRSIRTSSRGSARTPSRRASTRRWWTSTCGSPTATRS